MKFRRDSGKKLFKRRRQSRLAKILVRSIIALLIVLPILSAAIYYLFFNQINIVCGVLVDKKDNGNSISLELAYNGSTRWIKVNKDLNVPDSIGYNVSIKGIKVISISPSKVYTGTVLSRTNKDILLNSRDLKLYPKVNYVKVTGNTAVPVSPNNVVVGYSTYKFLADNNGIVHSVVVSTPDISTIRVGISNANFTSLDHKSLLFSSIYQGSNPNNPKYYNGRGMHVKASSGIDYTTSRGERLQVKYISGSIQVSVLVPIYGHFGKYTTKVIGTTRDRVYVSPVLANQEPIAVDSLVRTNGYRPVYFGTFEIYLNGDNLRLINDVNIEQYLRYVVPSEMSPFSNVEGYKAQAVAARTYALSDMLSGRFAASGFNVDDSTLSQVYNAQPPNPQSDLAIKETSGQVLSYKNNIIDAKYYSTSCGLGAPFNQVWYKGDGYEGSNPEPYLKFENYTNTNIRNLSSNAAASKFFKDWTINAYDSNAPLFRWKFSVSGSSFVDNIDKKIYSIYKNDPSSFEKKWYFNIYRKTQIPKNGVGKISDVSISKRGEAGNVLEMTIVSNLGTFRISKASNIKKLLTPSDPNTELTDKFGNQKPLNTFSATLPSDFFVLDEEISGNTIENVTIYGGGYGHGVGMSQNGVVGLEKSGENYQEILNTYYSGVQISNYKDILSKIL